MEETAPAPSLDQLVDSLIDNGLEEYLTDANTAAAAITWVTVNTGLPKLLVRMAYHWLMPIVLERAKKVGQSAVYAGASALGRRLTRLPGYEKFSRALLRLNTKLKTELADKADINKVLSGESRAQDVGELSSLSWDSKLVFKELAMLENLQDEMRDGFADILESINPQPSLYLDILESDENNQNFYGARETTFVGREQQLEFVGEFLGSPARFAWQLINGPSGMGKRRLGLELCLQHAVVWRSGHLPENNGFAEHWNTWQPERPTLILLHAASQRASETRHLIMTLTRRQGSLDWPVRLILTDSANESELEEQVLGKDVPGEDVAVRSKLVASSRYAAAMTLPRLSAKHLWAISEESLFARSYLDLPDERSYLEKLIYLDPLGTPLFALFAAQALVSSGDVGQLSVDALLKNVLARKLQRWHGAGVDEAHMNLAAVATILDGVSLEILLNPPVAGLLPLPADYDVARYQSLVGLPSNELLHPVDPQIIGDLFVLKHLEPNSILDHRAKHTRELVLAVDPKLALLGVSEEDPTDTSGAAREASFQAFFERAAHRFPGHPTLTVLRQPVPEKNRPHFSWGMHTAILIKHLDEEANFELCKLLYEDLKMLVFDNERDQLALLRGRFSEIAVVQMMRFANVPDPVSAENVMADLEALVDVDQDAVSSLSATRGVLVVALAGANETNRAVHQYQQMRAALGEVKGRIAFAVALAALKILQAFARKDDLASAQALYEDLQQLASANPDDVTVVALLGDALGVYFEEAMQRQDVEAAGEFLAAVAELIDELDKRKVPARRKPNVGKLIFGAIFTALTGDTDYLKPDNTNNEAMLKLLGVRLYAAERLLAACFADTDLSKAVTLYGSIKADSQRYSQHPELIERYILAGFEMMRCFGQIADDLDAARAVFEQMLEVAGLNPKQASTRLALAHPAQVLIRLYLEADKTPHAEEIASLAAAILRAPEVRQRLRELMDDETYEVVGSLVARVID